MKNPGFQVKNPYSMKRNRNFYDFSYKGQLYFYDARSGGVYQHHPLLREILSLPGPLDNEKILTGLAGRYPAAQVRELIGQLRRKKIIPLPDEDEVALKRKINEIYLQVSHKCNLNCVYCYAGGGSFGGPARMMSEKTARAAVDFLLNEAGPGNRCHINFDGGEPFLNFPLIKKTVRYAVKRAESSGHSVHFHIATNGTLFTRQRVEFLKQHHFGIGISLDGDRATHDQVRKFKDGEGSYQVIVNKLKGLSLFHYPRPVNARATIIKGALECSKATRHLRNLGFRHIYLEPASGRGEPWVVDEIDLPTILDEFTRIAVSYRDDIMKGNFFILRNFYGPLRKIHRRTRSNHRCHAAIDSIAVSFDGDLYPCYKFVGREEYKIGNIASGFWTGTRLNDFPDNRSDGKSPCCDCWARYLCGGGCAFLAVQANGDIRRRDLLDCRFTLHTIKLALEIYVAVWQRDQTVWDKLLGGSE